MQNFWFLLLEFLRKKKILFINQDERVGGVNNYQAVVLEKQSSPLQTDLYLYPSVPFFFLRRPTLYRLTGCYTFFLSLGL